jgi:hypothetical protein
MTTIIPDPTPAGPPAAYEDATVYRSSVVLHPLPGRPHFDGVLIGPGGPMARLSDGDLVLRADLATVTAWAAELERARQQLTQNDSTTEAQA